MKKRKPSPILFIIPVALLIGVVLLLLIPTESQKATKAIDSFYTYEQDTQYSSSYELFHPKMKERFTREHYMQTRGNFIGTNSFTYQISKPKKVRDWQMSADAEPFEEVYKVTVTKEIQGDSTNGNYQIKQDVYVAENLETGDWELLWGFN
ncbi:hypothetical protein JCM9140_4361 [Halalkalibacter wakoensis JCM 9140]|uniref:DUF4829 domain-containing protein n=1 Tax=Halalkalibacter wakoensis JCM 9140 TaxID=1236970 RepID=W4Q7U8_9BACI|nr:hypothetical protein [Halalkalibacter wakoensis]GAE28156.1 hypothetical protein JCM9140_4361 [Halalkalibacter wakoensis JCM 9140]